MRIEARDCEGTGRLQNQGRSFEHLFSLPARPSSTSHRTVTRYHTPFYEPSKNRHFYPNCGYDIKKPARKNGRFCGALCLDEHDIPALLVLGPTCSLFLGTDLPNESHAAYPLSLSVFHSTEKPTGFPFCGTGIIFSPREKLSSLGSLGPRTTAPDARTGAGDSGPLLLKMDPNCGGPQKSGWVEKNSFLWCTEIFFMVCKKSGLMVSLDNRRLWLLRTVLGPRQLVKQMTKMVQHAVSFSARISRTSPMPPTP